MSEAPRTVLVTGATGYVGFAVASALVAAGYEVSGTARTPANAAKLSDIGVTPVHVDLRNGRQLADAVRWVEVTVHCGFGASSPGDNMAAAVDLEQRTAAILVATTQETRGVLVYTSGVGVLARPVSGMVSEDAASLADSPMRWRYDLERLVADAGGRVIRPGLVYGRGGNEVIVDLIHRSSERRAAGYVGDGLGALPTVHLDDLTDAYLRVVASGTPGSTYTVVGGRTTPRDVADAIGRLIRAPGSTGPLDAETVARELPAAQWIAGDLWIDPIRAHLELGWTPSRPSLIEEIVTGSYAQPAMRA